MSVPEGFDRQRVDGDDNQTFGSVTGSNIFRDVSGGVTIEAAKRVTSPFQLPRDVTDFTGREAELAEIEAVLGGAGESRAVVISAVAGMAGVGKSALAICVAHRMKSKFPDAQLYVNLQGADAQPREAGDVLGEWLRALGLEGADIPMDLAARTACYRSQLANRRALVVLDNAHDTAQVELLLPGGSHCGVIVTSRRALTTLEGTKDILLKTLPSEQALALLGKLAGEARVLA